MIESIIFFGLAGLLVSSAVVVVTRTNPIASALALVLAFIALAALYGLLGAGFAAAIQILVYAGGILVLILFVIMILNLRQEDLLPMKPSATALGVVGVSVLVGFVLPLTFLLQDGFLGVAPKQAPSSFGSVEEVSRLMFGKYLFPFEVLSLVLLTAIVGALVISKRRL